MYPTRTRSFIVRGVARISGKGMARVCVQGFKPHPLIVKVEV